MSTEIGDHAPEMLRQEPLNPEVLDDVAQTCRRGNQAEIALSPPIVDPDHLPRISHRIRNVGSRVPNPESRIPIFNAP
jgi:hypothetical protein